MKTSNSKTKAFALGKTGATALITAATLTLALMFTACPNSAGGSGGASALGPKVKVTLKKKRRRQCKSRASAARRRHGSRKHRADL